MMASYKKRFYVLLLAIVLASGTMCAQDPTPQDETDAESIQQSQGPRRINDIIVVNAITGKSLMTPREAIINRVPYQLGEYFTPERSAQLIRNLYDLKRFRNITLKGKLVGDDLLDLYIIVEEKKSLRHIIFEGNKTIKSSEITKKVNLDIPAIDPEELKIIAEQIKKLYYEKRFQNVATDTEIIVDEDG